MASDGWIGALLIAVGTLSLLSPRWMLALERRGRGWTPEETRTAKLLGHGVYLWAVRIAGLLTIVLGLLWLVIAYHTRG